MDTNTASLSIIPPISDGEPTLKLSALTTAGFSIQGEISVETMQQIFRQIQKVSDELAHAVLLTEAQRIAQAQAVAYARSDGYVNPSYVRCMHDHCNDTVRAVPGQHPWDLARELGWKLKWAMSDLLCADCVGPKEDCPWKLEDHSEAF